MLHMRQRGEWKAETHSRPTEEGEGETDKQTKQTDRDRQICRLGKESLKDRKRGRWTDQKLVRTSKKRHVDWQWHNQTFSFGGRQGQEHLTGGRKLHTCTLPSFIWGARGGRFLTGGALAPDPPLLVMPLYTEQRRKKGGTDKR